MRQIMYGSSVVVTTDDVADAFFRLAVSVTNLGQTERIAIPIATDQPGGGTAELLIGPGIALMSQAAPWHGGEPDFSTGATLLRMHSAYPYHQPAGHHPGPMYLESDPWDPDLEGY